MKYPRKQMKMFILTMMSALFIPACAYAKDTIQVYYIVAAENVDGSGAQASMNDLKNGIAQLNAAYQPLALNFVISDIRYLTDNEVAGINSGDWNVDNEEDVRPYTQYGKLNVIVAGLERINGHAYWDYEGADIIEVKPENLSRSTIAHEFGHNLGLRHTYSGISGAPIAIQEGPSGWRFGDGIVDTPVDPGSRRAFNNCVYIGKHKDDEGQSYHPDGYNIMGKGQSSCRNSFTPQQLQRIARSLATSKFHLLNRYDINSNPTCNNSAIVTQFPHNEGLNYHDVVTDTPWVQDAYHDNLNWALKAYTSSSKTGANAPVEGHSFAHIDAGHDFLNPGDQVSLLSPCFNFNKQPTALIEFYYQMFGKDTGKLALSISIDDGITWTEVWMRKGQQHPSGDHWTKATLDLKAYMNSPFQLKFTGTVADGSKGDISIDNITLATKPYSEEQNL
jgi:hypothetical protein